MAIEKNLCYLQITYVDGTQDNVVVTKSEALSFITNTTPNQLLNVGTLLVRADQIRSAKTLATPVYEE